MTHFGETPDAYCFCPSCGAPDDEWEYVKGIVYECTNCKEVFEDLNAAWWFYKMAEDFWDGWFTVIEGQ